METGVLFSITIILLIIFSVVLHKKNRDQLSTIQEVLSYKLESDPDDLQDKFDHLKDSLKDNLDSNKEFINQSLESNTEMTKERLDSLDKNSKERIDGMNNTFTNSMTKLSGAATLLQQEVAPLSKNLNQVLGNHINRGIIGEISAEDVIKNLGLVKNSDYFVKKQFGGSYPDFSIVIPGGKYFNLDSKFTGLDNYMNYVEAIDTKDQNTQKECKKALLANLKQTIDQLSAKDYTDPQFDCYDKVMLFIPIPRILDFIFEQKIGNKPVLNYAHDKNVELVSPSNLHFTISTIRRFNRDERISSHIQDFLAELNGFNMEFNNLFDNTAGSKGIPFVAKKMQEAMNAVDHINGPRTKKFKKALNAMLEFDKREIIQDDDSKTDLREIA